MIYAFVFPGQGSQTVGMLDSFGDNDAVRETLAEASEAIGQDLEKLISIGPAEDLNLTINTQPAMLAAACAIYRAWLAEGGAAPAFVAGHSLGEYAALVASGVISFRDAVPLVRYRAQAMQDAVLVGQGGMAAVLGLDDDVVRQVCLVASAVGLVEPVNFNAPAQVVIAGERAGVDRACVLAKLAGARRALVLPVSAPFHSSLLKPSSDYLRDYLARLTFTTPKIPLINNVDVAIETDVDRIKDALVRQAASPVFWADSVQMLAANGVTHVVECGPGRVLTGLTKRINGELVGLSINDPVSLTEAMTLLK
ncbi:ACP S-malonyltransferase [Candidatus Pandoraea novymonadis]|uniref:Malonyl CoA-acyl carrier protein transacylase n=1 Tax=Candidatus Pandoraea novymonadis TaxID=1808959 RepID=A0ABX5FDW3_9BURK|nr:ACP S-malonyltransferase [Candidatus Pandoraea novymonadis]PSB91648.1 Malonyl CoA-acyl carrier protein transacylase [Candidatus Pandoraea novymonadis]